MALAVKPVSVVVSIKVETKGTTMKPAFHYEILVSPLHDADQLAKSTSALVSRLQQLDGVGAPPDHSSEIPYLMVVGTGGTEIQIIERWRLRQTVCAGEPALLVAHREDNSLPAALEALARIHQEGASGHIVMANRAGDLARSVADQVAYLDLQQIRIGVVGEPSDWLVASTVSADAIRHRWGPTLVDLETATLVDAGSGQPSEQSVILGQRWAGSDEGGSLATLEVEHAAQIHEPLADLISEHDLDAVTVRCFDLLGTAQTSGCLALAELNSAGIVAGCEGDLASAVAMLWVRELLGSASWMANPADVNSETGEVVLAHCTVAPSLVAEFELSTHFESGLGVGIAGRFRRQPVTLVRLGGRNLERSWIVDGELVASGNSAHLCRTQATIVIPPEDAATVLERPLGNHIVMVPGHHAGRLRDWWRQYVSDPD